MNQQVVKEFKSFVVSLTDDEFEVLRQEFSDNSFSGSLAKFSNFQREVTAVLGFLSKLKTAIANLGPVLG